MVVAFTAASCIAQRQAESYTERYVPAGRSSVPPEKRVDINHAKLEELLKVPGMTSTWAQRILRFRPYRSKQDLMDQGVVPDAFYARIKDYVIAHREAKE